MAAIAVSVKRLGVRSATFVEIDGRRYDVVSDQEGGVALSRR